MKKVIGSKRYDSDTAKVIGSVSYGEENNLDFVCEDLHRTKSGLFFIHGWGGARSKYAKHVADNSWTGGEDIFPLTYEAAAEWAEKNLKADEYTAAFSVPDADDMDAADDEKIAITLIISKKAKNKLSKLKVKTGKTMSQIIEEAIEKI